jgi:hypothetical protein
VVSGTARETHYHKGRGNEKGEDSYQRNIMSPKLDRRNCGVKGPEYGKRLPVLRGERKNYELDTVT